MDLNIGCIDVDWIGLAQNKVQWETCEHGNETSRSVNG
jgi:hypothetical protein